MFKPNQICKKTGYYIIVDKNRNVIDDTRTKHMEGLPFCDLSDDQLYWEYSDNDDTKIGGKAGICFKGYKMITKYN